MVATSLTRVRGHHMRKSKVGLRLRIHGRRVERAFAGSHVRLSHDAVDRILLPAIQVVPGRLKAGLARAVSKTIPYYCSSSPHRLPLPGILWPFFGAVLWA